MEPDSLNGTACIMNDAQQTVMKILGPEAKKAAAEKAAADKAAADKEAADKEAAPEVAPAPRRSSGWWF
ncbi:hypothetical protein JADG_001268 [Aureobasidium aubasidani]|nr:hypothetical protein JADG_001268 [Aureobasidium pullulans]